jgi:hypothetical protein
MADKKTFYIRALLRFKTQAAHSYRRAMDWYHGTLSKVRGIKRAIADWVTKNSPLISISISAVIFIGATIGFIEKVFEYLIDNITLVNIIAAIVCTIFGLLIIVFASMIYQAVANFIITVLVSPSLGLVYYILVAIVYVALFTLLLISALSYGVYLVLLVVSQFLLLVPLTVLVFMERLWLLWRRIFYTCPNRECSYRGLPIHVCSKCGKNHKRLWPNRFGVFYHTCDCGTELPTLDVLGRKRLTRLCAACKIRLFEDIGGLPEELVALVGGPSVGKTNFLLMSTRRLLNGKVCRTGNNSIKAELIVPAQKQELTLGIENLENGIPPGKTQRTHKMAYLLRMNRQSRKSLLYYYDAAGEEYSSINRDGRHENIKHLDGLILLVDPFSLEGLNNRVREEDTGLRASETPWGDVVSSTIATLRRIPAGKNRRKSIPLAVVITKTDVQSVQEMLGDIKKRLPGSEQCEKALVRWGARNSVELLRQHFDTLRFFACSALGRSPGSDNGKPFRDYGIMEPLQWILNA